MNLTPEEQKLLELVRNLRIEFGKITLVLHFQHGKLVRVETIERIESKAIK